MGANEGTVGDCYTIGSVTGGWQWVGGLLGRNLGGVSNSFWDTGTSGQATSAPGTGKTTTEMKSIGTFFGAGWSIITIVISGASTPRYLEYR